MITAGKGTSTIRTPESLGLYREIRSAVRAGGILAGVMDTVEQFEFIQQPLFRISAGLTAMMMAVGPKIQNRSGIRADLWAANIAQTSEGKAAPIQVIKAIGQSIASPTACITMPASVDDLARFLVRDPHRIMVPVRDELSQFLWPHVPGTKSGAVVKSLDWLRRAGRGPCFVPYSWEAKTKRESEWPMSTAFIGILGSGIPQIVRNAIRGEKAKYAVRGALPKTLLFVGEGTNPMGLGNPTHNIDHELLGQISRWRDWNPAEGGHITQANGHNGEAFIQFDDEIGAAAIIQDWFDDESMNEDEAFEAALHVSKISLLLAADTFNDPRDMACAKKPIVRTAHAELASRLVRFLMDRSSREFGGSPSPAVRAKGGKA